MDRELTFHPETERTRDLLYSEYSSCDRSVHLLIQESPSVPYDLLLKVYRETVSAYLSSEEIRPPEDFIENLLARFDELAKESGLPMENWRTIGIHLVLRTVNALYLVTSREWEVGLRVGDGFSPIAESCEPERLRFGRGDVQRELFPSRLGDFLSVLRIDPGRVSDRDLVLGCPEDDKRAVLDGLSNPIWLDPETGADTRASRRSMVSGFVSRRILVLRFGGPARDSVRSPETRERPRIRLPRVDLRRGLVVVGAVVVVALLIGVLWRNERNGDGRIRSERGSPSRETVANRSDGATRADRAPSRAEQPLEVRLSEVWRRSYPDQVTSSPVIVGESVVFGCRDGGVYALDRVSGAPLWRFAASSGVGASPAVHGDRIIVADYNGYAYAVGAADGKEVWREKLPTKVVSSPAVSGDRVLFCGVDGYAYCLSAADGKLLWKRSTKGRIRGSPVSGGAGFFVPSYDGYLYALSAGSGEVVWRVALGGPVSATPAAREGCVVVGGSDGGVRCLDAATGMAKWNYATGDAVKSSLAISGDKALFGSNDGCVYCMNVADGTTAWKYQTGGIVLARPAVRDGVVYAGSYDGRLYALDAVNGRPLAVFEAGGEIFSSPAVDEERVYFGTNRGDVVSLAHHRGESS